MPVTVSVHAPLLIRVSGRSLNASTQTLPKLPVSAITKSSSGAGAVPETATIRGLAGSLLTMRERGRFAPKLAGRKRTGIAIESPAPTTSG